MRRNTSETKRDEGSSLAPFTANAVSLSERKSQGGNQNGNIIQQGNLITNTSLTTQQRTVEGRQKETFQTQRRNST